MKKLNSIAILLCAAVLSSCGTKTVQDISGPFPTARIKFFNFGVNAPGVNFYANTTKLTAISSTTGIENVLGTGYGLPGSGGFYSAIAPGQYALAGTIAAATDKDLAIAKINTTIVDGKSYSFYLSGFYDPAAKAVDGFIVEDPYVAAIDFSVAYVRFVHAISNANPLTLYAKSTTTGVEVALGTSVPYKGAGVFTPLANDVYDLSARYAGSTTNAISRLGVSFLAGRVYTIGALGDITIVSTSATNRPRLDNTANR
jgi:hypothetical protein